MSLAVTPAVALAVTRAVALAVALALTRSCCRGLTHAKTLTLTFACCAGGEDCTGECQGGPTPHRPCPSTILPFINTCAGWCQCDVTGAPGLTLAINLTLALDLALTDFGCATIFLNPLQYPDPCQP